MFCRIVSGNRMNINWHGSKYAWNWNVVNERCISIYKRTTNYLWPFLSYCFIVFRSFCGIARWIDNYLLTAFLIVIIYVIYSFCISNLILIYAICGILSFVWSFSTGGHAPIEEQDPLPNEDIHDENSLHHSHPVNSEFITISVSSNEHAEKAKEQFHNG